MRKEVLWAIIIGITLGFVSMATLEARKRKKTSSVSLSPTPTLAPSPSPKATLPSLTITEPENETVSSKEKITVKGKTDPLATVVVIWEEGEDILVASDDGTFQTEIELAAGPNEIEISAYNEEGQVNKKILTVTYSTAKF